MTSNSKRKLALRRVSAYSAARERNESEWISRVKPVDPIYSALNALLDRLPGSVFNFPTPEIELRGISPAQEWLRNSQMYKGTAH